MLRVKPENTFPNINTSPHKYGIILDTKYWKWPIFESDPFQLFAHLRCASKGNSDVLVWLYWHEYVRGVTEVSILWVYSIFWTFGTHCRCSEVSESQRGLAVILQCMNRSNGLRLDELICLVTKFNIDLLQSSIIALLTYGHSSQHYSCHVT
jgi:hypothetical protein